MGEHKHKAPGEFKGPGYKKDQTKTIRARWAVVAELGKQWPEKHVPGYLERKRKAEAEKRRKEVENRAKAARGAAISRGTVEGPAPADRGATGPELTFPGNDATIEGGGK